MNTRGLRPRTAITAAAAVGLAGDGWRTRTLGAAEPSRSHPPLRPLSAAPERPLVPGPKRFVGAARGQDGNAGDTLNKTVHVIRILRPPSLPALAATRDPSRCAAGVRGFSPGG